MIKYEISLVNSDLLKTAEKESLENLNVGFKFELQENGYWKAINEGELEISELGELNAFVEKSEYALIFYGNFSIKLYNDYIE